MNNQISIVYHLDEMDQFLQRYTLPKYTQEEIDNPKRSLSLKEIK
jgi:hypothetical protein